MCSRKNRGGRIRALRSVRSLIQRQDASLLLLMQLERLIENNALDGQAPGPSLRALPVESLEIEFQYDGSARVEIGGAEGFKLPPDLAALLNVLSEDSGESKDALVAWKSYKEISRRLGEKRGKKGYSKHALQSAIYRLRERLQRHRFARDLIQYRSGLGYRFAVLKASAASRAEAPLPGLE